MPNAKAIYINREGDKKIVFTIEAYYAFIKRIPKKYRIFAVDCFYSIILT